MEAARAAGDQAALGQACYRLGKAYTELEDATRLVVAGFWCACILFVNAPADAFKTNWLNLTPVKLYPRFREKTLENSMVYCLQRSKGSLVLPSKT